MKKTLLTLAAVVGISAAGHAQIVTWDMTGLAGDEASVEASYEAAFVTGLDMARGSGLTASAASNSFSSSGFSGEAADYISFGFTIADGYSLDLSTLLIGTRSSNQGPGSLGLYYSGDSFSTLLYTFTQSGTAFLNSSIDLSSLANLTGTIEFRLYAIGTTSANGGTLSSSGTFRLTDYFSGGSEASNIAFSGTLTAVPEPQEYAAGFAGVLMMVILLRRRRLRA